MAPREGTIDQAALLLIKGMSQSAVATWCINALGLDPDAAAELVAEARRKLTVAASYNRDEQLGVAIARLNDLFSRAMAPKVPDLRTAIQAQKELNRLLCLYSPPTDGAPASDVDAASLVQQIELIESYVKPLGLVAETYPLVEHVRVAAEIIRSQGLSGVPPETRAS